MGGGGRAPCCDKSKVKRGPWSPAEDVRLVSFIQKHGHPNWRSLPKQAGLLRCGKSCRLRWINYLRPDLKRGNFTPQEEHSIIRLHATYGNKWSKIASHLPGRTDNEIKNVWNTHLKKRSLVINNTNDTNKNQSRDVPNISNGQEISERAILVEADTIIDQPSTPSSTISCNSDQDNYGKAACCSWGDTPPCPHYETIKINNHEIPLESEVEFWNMLESQPITHDDHDHDQGVVGFLNKPCKDQDMELEYWVRLLEEELGLVSPTADSRSQVDKLDHEQTKNKDVHEMWCKTISDQISPFWPTSPMNNWFF